MEKELLNSIQVQEFLTDFEETSTIELLEEGGKEENELFQIAEARGILLKGSRDLAGFKTVYTFADKANGNKARLPKKVLLRALPGIVGKPVDIDHNRSRVIGYYIDYKYIVKDESVVAYGIIFKSNFAEEWKTAQQLFRSGKLTSSYEIWCPKGKRKYLPDGTYELTEQEVAGGAILFKTKPAFAEANVLEMAKINDEDMVYASKHHHPCEEMIIKGETICRKCGNCKHEETPEVADKKDEVGTKPALVAPFAISEKEKPENKDVVGQKPRNNPPHSVASVEESMTCPKCAYKGIPNKKVVGDKTNTYTYACSQCNADISTPFSSSVKCANCAYIIDKPFVTANEIKCPECKAILNQKGETKYPPQHIDFKMACPACSSRNWRILKSEDKNSDIKCMSCQKAYNVSYQADPKATTMTTLHFLHTGSVPCAQCGERVNYMGISKNRKYEVACGNCQLRFSHDITNEMIRRIGSINEMTQADYETKYGQPSDLQDVSQPKMNSDHTPINKEDRYVHKASLVEFKYQLNETTDVVLEGKILQSEDSKYILEVAGYEGIFIVNEKELISTADELIDKSANTIVAKGEQKMEKKEIVPSAEIETPVEASIDDSYEDGFEVAKKLTTEDRNALSDKDFGVVIHKDGKTIRKYPMKDPAHVRNALSRLGQEAPKAGLKTLGVSPESVRAKVLRRAKELNMHLTMDKADIDSYDTEVTDDKSAEKVAQKLIKAHDDALFLQDKTAKEQKMAEEEEKKESVVEEKKEEKENENKAFKAPDIKDDAEALAKKLAEADLKKGKPDLNREIADLKKGKPDYNPELADLKSGKPDMQRDIANKDSALNKDLTGRTAPKADDLKQENKECKNDNTADLKAGKPDIQRNIADLKSGKPDMQRDIADLKSGKPDMDRTVADLKSGKPDLNRELADLKKPVADEKHVALADLKSGKPDINRNIADLKKGKPDMNRELAEYKGYDAPTTDDDADKLAQKLAMAKACIAKHLACVKSAHKKIQEAKRLSKASLETANFYKENAEEITKRRKEVGLEVSSKLTDKEILDNTKFADVKLEKANLEVAKNQTIGSKNAPEDERAKLRAEIDKKAYRWNEKK